MVRFTLAGTVLLVLSVLVPAQSDAQGLDDPRKAVDIFVKATAAGDFATLGALYAPKAILLAPGAPVIAGRDAIAAVYQRNMRAGDNKIVFGNVSFDGQGDFAVVLWEWTSTITPQIGKVITTKGRSLVYFKNTSEGWEIVADMFQPRP